MNMSKNVEIFKDIEKYEKLLGNPREFIETFCYITTKDGKFERLKLNYPQDKMMKIVEDKLKKGEPIRIRVLKARQMGFSTLISALGFWWAAMNENSAYAVVAHKESSAASIFNKNKIFYDNLPPKLKPQTDKFNSEQISFNTSDGKGLRSKIFFGTAGGGELFRGETILFLHKSEIAFWQDTNGVLKKSLNATVPYSPFSCIIEETTANGYNEFKDNWDRSVRGENNYIPLFVGWNEMEDYKITPPLNFKLTEEELKLQMEYDLSDAQLCWRRTKIEDDYEGNELWFQQEYPLTPEEAFISSGMGVFSGEVIKQGYLEASKPIMQKEINSVMTNKKLLIWEEPEIKEKKEYQQLVKWDAIEQDYKYYDGDIELGVKITQANYTIGIDTSGMGADLNQIVVWHNIKKKMVARFEIEQMNEEKLAAVAVEIAKYYNNGLIAPEVNYSHAICDYIIELGYKNIYVTENMARIDKKSQSLEYGWKTTKLSKAPIISALRALLSENPGAIPDRDFWYEAEYYVLQDIATNKMNAVSGHHDDIIMACAIANYVSNSFQSKQTYTHATRMEKSEDKKESYGIIGVDAERIFGKKKTNRLKKGVYSNNA